MSSDDARPSGEDAHTDWRDCELPDTASDGDTVVCEGCGREWDYHDGWFTLATDGGTTSPERYADNAADRTATKRAIVGCLDGDAAGLATPAIAHRVSVDTRTARQLLGELAGENVVERVGAAGLGRGQWRLVGEME